MTSGLTPPSCYGVLFLQQCGFAWLSWGFLGCESEGKMRRDGLAEGMMHGIPYKGPRTQIIGF